MSVSNSDVYALSTADTTRVFGLSPLQFNTYVTKMIYPSSEVEWRPNGVILVPYTSYHFGLLASPLVHFPNNAPIIFTDPNVLYLETINEIIRLAPTGEHLPTQVMIVGPVSLSVETELRNYGFSTLRVTGPDPLTAAGEALEFRYKIPSESMEGNENIMVVSAEDFSECIHAAYFSAHMGVPILFAYRNALPSATREKLIKYSSKNVFVIGSERTISNNVYREIQSIIKGKVDRIGGDSAYQSAINFAKYYSHEGMFGWNINKKDGWSFSFGLLNNWVDNLSASIFAHLAKHTPLLYIEPFSVPTVTRQFVLSVNPKEKHPPKPPFMHGYILGGFEKVSHNTQVELEEVLILRAGG